MSNRTRERLRALENYLDDPTVVSAGVSDLPIVVVPWADLAWLVRSLSEYASSERLDTAVDRTARGVSLRAEIDRLRLIQKQAAEEVDDLVNRMVASIPLSARQLRGSGHGALTVGESASVNTWLKGSV